MHCYICACNTDICTQCNLCVRSAFSAGNSLYMYPLKFISVERSLHP